MGCLNGGNIMRRLSMKLGIAIAIHTKEAMLRGDKRGCESPRQRCRDMRKQQDGIKGK